MKEKSVILIVDDVASNIQVLATFLKDTYDLKIANNGQRALGLATTQPYPDLILLDISMPEMDGYEVFRKLQENDITHNVPVIFVTGSDTIQDEEKGLTLGAVDYITKPINPAIVKARVNTHLLIKYQRDELLYNASHDQLTGLYNRHVLAEEGQRKFARAHRKGDDLSVIMLDIDYFKKINDTYGHLMGDTILIAVADILSVGMRVEDFTARFGGEEFVIILENCNADFAKEKAEVLRKKIESTVTDGANITASFGICQLNDTHNTFELLLKSADDALYKAKEAGRNRVEVCS